MYRFWLKQIIKLNIEKIIVIHLNFWKKNTNSFLIFIFKIENLDSYLWLNYYEKWWYANFCIVCFCWIKYDILCEKNIFE